MGDDVSTDPRTLLALLLSLLLVIPGTSPRLLGIVLIVVAGGRAWTAHPGGNAVIDMPPWHRSSLPPRIR